MGQVDWRKVHEGTTGKKNFGLKTVRNWGERAKNLFSIL